MIFASFSDFRVLHHSHQLSNRLITMTSSTFDNVYELSTFNGFTLTTTEAAMLCVKHHLTLHIFTKFGRTYPPRNLVFRATT
jgi:hypothetical protein